MRVLVIGAGFAGLAAGQRLAAEGHEVDVIEARDRIGGRVYTKREGTGEYPIELGAEWLDNHSLVPDLVRASGGTVHEASGRYLLRTNGEIVSSEERPDDRLMRRLKSLGGDDHTLVEALRACCHGDEWELARATLVRYVEGFHAADPLALSAQWLLQVESTQSADASQARSESGLDLAANALRPETGTPYRLRLSTIARHVRWKRGEVVVEVERAESAGTLHRFESDAQTVGSESELVADAAIVTLPLSILRLPPDHSSAVRFEPPLSPKLAAFEHLSMGDAVKIVVEFDEPFWEKHDATRGMLFLNDWTCPIPTWWTTLPRQSARLTGWVGGPMVRRIGDARGDDVLDPALDSLAQIVGRARSDLQRSLRAWHFHDWRNDPFSLGAYSWVRSGGVEAHRVLAAPLDETLFFAGEATRGGGFNASVRGAVESGRRAADELLASRALLAPKSRAD